MPSLSWSSCQTWMFYSSVETYHFLFLRLHKAEDLSSRASDCRCIRVWLATGEVDHLGSLAAIKLPLDLISRQNDSRLEGKVRWEGATSYVDDWKVWIQIEPRIPCLDVSVCSSNTMG